ncbi:transcriptional regulator [Burkholderia sp. Bp8992]|uniref:ogr/Delta-like zinc finger family protein n=1 Tax=Burkholderia sp. Bp8992 TaxID=2184554 RepID=UPI000F5793FE|nr:ogr/Delta-like zinc finger family protein [Burkholderia sp. Bp8992]RQS28006.1 transcriptional regulator [Burkholderia sp. Bp8992]
MKLKCHHCGSRAVIRTSRMLSLLSREYYCQCENIECSHTYRALMSVTHTVAPSLRPNPKVYLPVGKVKRLPQDPRQLSLIDA